MQQYFSGLCFKYTYNCMKKKKQTEEKAKVVAAVWGIELNAELAN